MAPWKSREGKLPASNFYAQIAVYLAEAYPDAKIDRAQLDALKPVWDRLWQEGKTADIVAKTTCSCDGKKITPSPAIDLERLPKGVVRAPVGLERGQLFDPETVRGSASVEKVKRERQRTVQLLERERLRLTKLAEMGSRAKGGRRTALEEKFGAKKAAAQTRLMQLQVLNQQIEQLQSELRGQRLYRKPSAIDEELPDALMALVERPKKEKAPKKPKAEKAPKAPKAAKPAAPAKDRPARKPRPAATPSADTAAQDAVLLAKISELLPGIANTLAQQIKKP